MKTVPAGQFKATCLKLMDRVAVTGEPVVITKRGKPLVRVVPVRQGAGKKRSTVFGAGKGTILYLAPDEELFSTGAKWNAQD
ncbi:MAG: type II toxin-antitoxin system Phd/YefM family antitoxin [Polyangiaceae bacterium]